MLAIFPFEALQILPYLVRGYCGSQTMKSPGKAVQPHLQITQMHLAATRRPPVLQHFANDFLNCLRHEGVSLDVVFHNCEQAHISIVGECEDGILCALNSS